MDGGEDFKFKNAQLSDEIQGKSCSAGAELTGLVVSRLEEGLKRPGSADPRWIHQQCERQRSDCIRENQKNNHPEDGVTQGIGNQMDRVTAVAWIPISYIRF